MLLNEGAAGAAQYEEAYGRGAGNAGRLIGGPAAGGPRKLGKPNEDNAPEAAAAPQRESLPPMTLPSGAIYTG